MYLHLGGVASMDAAGLGRAALLRVTHLSAIPVVYETEEEALAPWREDSPEISSHIPAVV